MAILKRALVMAVAGAAIIGLSLALPAAEQRELADWIIGVADAAPTPASAPL